MLSSSRARSRRAVSPSARPTAGKSPFSKAGRSARIHRPRDVFASGSVHSNRIDGSPCRITFRQPSKHKNRQDQMTSQISPSFTTFHGPKTGTGSGVTTGTGSASFGVLLAFGAVFFLELPAIANHLLSPNGSPSFQKLQRPSGALRRGGFPTRKNAPYGYRPPGLPAYAVVSTKPSLSKTSTALSPLAAALAAMPI